MSTTQRGTSFEETIYLLLKQQIEEGRFWARAECCRLFRKKGYHSKDRNKQIIFDVSIEISLPGEELYSLLVLVECKDYSAKVPVDDVEEFWAKVQQVAGANVKGILASTAAFQESGFRFAESKGFALLRYLGQADFKWVLKRSASWSGSDSRAEARAVRTALTTETVASSYYDCCFFLKTTYTYSSNRLFQALCLHDVAISHSDFIARVSNPQRHEFPTVPHIEKNDIEDVANRCLNQIGYSDGSVDLMSICEWQREERGLFVEQGARADDERTLGFLSFDPVLIRVFEGHNVGRTRFTLAHELGHLFMGHDRFLSSEVTTESDLKHDSHSSLEFVDLSRMEWQANFFASCLLLPSTTFAARFYSIAQRLDLYDRGFGLLYVDHQPVNTHNFYTVTNHLSALFEVSRQAVVIRLLELGYLNDVRSQSGLRPLITRDAG